MGMYYLFLWEFIVMEYRLSSDLILFFSFCHKNQYQGEIGLI
jgi:hypothetical protein